MSGGGPLREHERPAAEAATRRGPAEMSTRSHRGPGSADRNARGAAGAAQPSRGLGGEPQQTWLEVLQRVRRACSSSRFCVTVATVPIMQHLALANGVIDHPSDPRKVHRMPIAYLGGVAVYLGIMGGIFFSYLGVASRSSSSTTRARGGSGRPGPALRPALDPARPHDHHGHRAHRRRHGHQPAREGGGAAARGRGARVRRHRREGRRGGARPTLGAAAQPPRSVLHDQASGRVPARRARVIELDIIYWTGTAVIAVFVLGACNASNLIDGLDGLLSGTTAIASSGCSRSRCSWSSPTPARATRSGSSCAWPCSGGAWGFLPHNFNPATIFLGDCGSLMLGYATIVIILTLGDTGAPTW
jgi:UDP-GlcNAc:undecaprenyl-phosphate GlcNAc-1-phosphate transferase